jgi:hypothetical protein
VLDDRGSIPGGKTDFFFSSLSRPYRLWNAIQRIPAALSPGVKRPAREADHSPPSSAEVRKYGAIPPLPQYVFMSWCLVKRRDNLPLPSHSNCCPKLAQWLDTFLRTRDFKSKRTYNFENDEYFYSRNFEFVDFSAVFLWPKFVALPSNCLRKPCGKFMHVGRNISSYSLCPPGCRTEAATLVVVSNWVITIPDYHASLLMKLRYLLYKLTLSSPFPSSTCAWWLLGYIGHNA